MSNPPGEKVVGTLRVPSPDPVAAEIQAEISDHLATAADQLQSQGLTADAALQKSQQKFGSTAAISRRCYWIQQGDALMFRTAVILLLSLLCIALGATVFSTWRTQRHTAEQMAALAEQLKLLAEQKAASPTSITAAEPKPLEITGTVFLGSTDKPSSNTEVMICRVSDGEIIRRFTTRGDGSFRSGPLGAGDYSLVVKDSRSPSPRPLATQTAPIYVYPGMQIEPLKIDVAYQGGQMGVKLSSPLPSLRVEGTFTIESRLHLEVLSPRLQIARWTAIRPAPERWPIYIQDAEAKPNDTADRGDRRSYSQYRQAVLSNEDLAEGSSFDFLYGRDRLLPTGPCSVVATLVADVQPDGFKEPERTGGVDGLFGASRQSPGGPAMEWMSKDWVLHETMGAKWERKLLQGRSPPTMNGGMRMNRGMRFSFDATPIEIVRGEQTVVQIEIPPDVVTRIQSLVESVTDPDEFRDAVYKDNPFRREAQVRVVGHKLLEPAEAPIGRPN